MLSENIKNIRKAKGLSQEELAVRLNVVRQTVSKWEQGLSVPDADMLISVSEVLGTPVSTLLGETVAPQPADEVKAIAEKLEAVNLQLAKRKLAGLELLFWSMISLSAVIIALSVFLIVFQSGYLNWNFNDPETAIAGTFLHAFEFVFVRIAPIALIGAVVVSVIARRKISSIHI